MVGEDRRLPTAAAPPPFARRPLLSKKLHRMRLDPSFCEVQPARALYRGGVNNGGCIYESEKVRSKPFAIVPLGRILQAATRNLQSSAVADCTSHVARRIIVPRAMDRPPSATSQTARRTSHVASLCPGLWTGLSLCMRICEPQSASRNPRAVGQSQAAARRLQLAASRPGMC